MSTEAIYKIKSESSKDTEKLARKLGGQLRGGEVIELTGDVGAGKTTFVRGLAKGLKSTDRVSSPTFTAYRVYSGRLTLYHFDFYRIADDWAVRNELQEIVNDDNAVIVIEWAESIKDALPASRIKALFKTVSDNDRQLTFSIPQETDYIKL